MMALFFKCLIGALIVLVIAAFSKSKFYYIAGLVPLFPTFTLIANAIVAKEDGIIALRKTVLFGLWSLIPYILYLLTVYILSTKISTWLCLTLGTVNWIISAAILVYIWRLFH